MNRKHQEGFTLVEMMLVVAISTFVVFAIFSVLRAGDEQAQVAQEKMTIQESVREGLYRMMQELRMSAPDQITIPADHSYIQFKIPDPVNRFTDQYVIDWAKAKTVRYYRGGTDGNQLLRTAWDYDDPARPT